MVAVERSVLDASVETGGGNHQTSSDCWRTDAGSDGSETLPGCITLCWVRGCRTSRAGRPFWPEGSDEHRSRSEGRPSLSMMAGLFLSPRYSDTWGSPLPGNDVTWWAGPLAAGFSSELWSALTCEREVVLVVTCRQAHRTAAPPENTLLSAWTVIQTVHLMDLGGVTMSGGAHKLCSWKGQPFFLSFTTLFHQ